MRAVKTVSTRDFSGLCRALLARGMRIEFTARGNSMRPAIGCGDKLILDPAPPKPLESGQVVLTVDDDRLLIHRLVARRDGNWITRGDNCRSDDRPVSEGNILAPVVDVHSGGRGLPRENWLSAVRAGILRGLRKPAAAAQSWRLYRRLGRCVLASRYIRFGWANSTDEHAIRRLYGAGAAASRRHPKSRIVLARIGKHAVGGTILQPYLREPQLPERWIFGMQVPGPLRALGIGEGLLNWCLVQAECEGAEKLLLWVRRDNRAAISLYAKWGFVALDLPKRAAPGGFLTMCRPLGAKRGSNDQGRGTKSSQGQGSRVGVHGQG